MALPDPWMIPLSLWNAGIRPTGFYPVADSYYLENGGPEDPYYNHVAGLPTNEDGTNADPGDGGGGGGGGGNEPDPVDFEERVRTLYPWLPAPLVKIFAEAWEKTGDRNLALAEMRAHDRYEDFFPGIKRADGSLRMTEQEWFSTREAYSRLLSDFGLNPDVFTDRFTGLMEGDVSPAELAQRLGGAYEQIVTNIPQVRAFYADAYGIEMSDQAIFASFIDPDIGDAVLNRRLSVAAVGGEGLARGFDVTRGFAERLADAGVTQGAARGFFSQAEARLPILESLAQRHADPDDTFDLGELANAEIFGDSEQARRVRRLFDAEASSFSEQLGTVATGQDFGITGLRTL